MEHLCGDERLTLAGMKYGNRKEFQANSLPSLLSPSLQVKGLATTAQRAFIAGPTPAPRGRQAPRPLRPSALFLWLSSLHVRISCYQFLCEFSPLDDPKAKTEKIGAFRVFFKVQIKQKQKKKKIFWGQNSTKQKLERVGIFFVFLVQIQPKKKKKKRRYFGGQNSQKKNQKKGWNFLCFLVQIQKN